MKKLAVLAVLWFSCSAFSAVTVRVDDYMVDLRFETGLPMEHYPSPEFDFPERTVDGMLAREAAFNALLYPELAIPVAQALAAILNADLPSSIDGCDESRFEFCYIFIPNVILYDLDNLIDDYSFDGEFVRYDYGAEAVLLQSSQGVQILANSEYGGDTVFGVFDRVVFVPEPSYLFLIALAALGVARRY